MLSSAQSLRTQYANEPAYADSAHGIAESATEVSTTESIALMWIEPSRGLGAGACALAGDTVAAIANAAAPATAADRAHIDLRIPNYSIDCIARVLEDTLIIALPELLLTTWEI